MDKTALYKLSYGLYVVGVKAPQWFGGCVVDAVAQVDGGTPPILILSCLKNNWTNELLKAEKEFTLSVLPENVDPFVLANFGLQSARAVDKWRNVPHTVKDGLPALQDAAAYLRCQVTENKELPEHTVFFCSVLDAWPGVPVKPLIYADYRQNLQPAAKEAFQKFKEQAKAESFL
ncbi:MAG: flavin reductase family protein [Candidatus Margulisbacteria bacterium]|jgi:flavin reductase (DIM6/NTAB) family NADH-FMN oxidoreductase RutF|nr:flavin reductase family protein [Candidatus Margulisiibacteriota bacterium]